MDLEWDRVLEALADRCVGPMGRELALTLDFATTREETELRLEEARRNYDWQTWRAGAVIK